MFDYESEFSVEVKRNLRFHFNKTSCQYLLTRLFPLNTFFLITACKQSCLKVMFSQVFVCSEGGKVGNIKCIMG